MSIPAFFLPACEWHGECRLGGAEAHHALVLRLRPGAEIILLDGRGKAALCRIRAINGKSLDLELIRQWESAPPESRPIIALALSKAARRGFFLEKAAELGAWQVWLWQAERSQGAITAKLAAACRAQLVAGAKQCHNPWFPALETLGNVELLGKRAQECALRLLPWEQKAGEAVISLAQLGQPGDTVYVIGPEGGLAEWEADCLIHSGFEPVSLGERVLRCETAATLCLGLHCWASQREKGAQ